MKVLKRLNAWLHRATPPVRLLRLPANELPRGWQPKLSTLPIEQRYATQEASSHD